MRNNHRQNKSGSFVKSIGYACSGIASALKSETNLRIQFVTAGLVLILAWILMLPLGQISVLVITVTFVLVIEIVNTAVESLADVVHPNHHMGIQKLKDMMAGAVMLSSLSAVIVGILILAPPIVSLFV